MIKVYHCSHEVGSLAYLKNFRKGLKWQKQKCQSELDAATAEGDATSMADALHRLQWIREKQRRLGERGVMVFDKPSWQGGRDVDYGSLNDDARRLLTAQEVRWNEAEMRKDAAAATTR